MTAEESYTLNVVDNGFVVDYKPVYCSHKSRIFTSLSDALSFIANEIKNPPIGEPYQVKITSVMEKRN
jgi:hypothetical protein